MSIWLSCHCDTILDMRNGLAIQSRAHSPPVPQMECSQSPSPQRSVKIRIFQSSNPVLPNYGNALASSAPPPTPMAALFTYTSSRPQRRTASATAASCVAASAASPSISATFNEKMCNDHFSIHCYINGDLRKKNQEICHPQAVYRVVHQLVHYVLLTLRAAFM